MTRLPLRRTRVEGRRFQHKLRQADRRLQPIVIIKEPQVTCNYCSQIMSYILDMFICVYMIFLDNLLQYLLFINMIDLSRTYDNTDSLICYALIMLMIYLWIKIKLKLLLFPTESMDHNHRSISEYLHIDQFVDYIYSYLLGRSSRGRRGGGRMRPFASPWRWWTASPT
jgi:hypothetical protein